MAKKVPDPLRNRGKLMTPVLKILRADEWTAFDRDGCFAGSPDDVRDGFIHLSTPEQAAATRERHFAGVAGLWQVTLDAEALGPELRWEISRGGASFPHLYRALERADVVNAAPV
jgi:uncharacterized protein (DUF952 family)